MITRAQIEKLGALHAVEPTMLSLYLAVPPSASLMLWSGHVLSPQEIQAKIESLNPEVHVETFDAHFSVANAKALVEAFDEVVEPRVRLRVGRLRPAHRERDLVGVEVAEGVDADCDQQAARSADQRPDPRPQ